MFFCPQNCWLLIVPLISVSGARAASPLPPDGGPGSGAVVQPAASDQSVGQIVRRCLDGDISSAIVLDLASRLGDGFVDTLFDELESEAENASLSGVAVRAFESAMKEVPGVVLESGASPEAHRAAALRVLGRRGTRADIDRVFALSASRDGQLASGATLDALEGALVRIFARFPADIGRVRQHLQTIDSAQRVRLIRALGEHGQNGPFGSDRALTLLSDLLQGDEMYRAMILAQMGRLAPPLMDGGALARVRSLLHTPGQATQRETVLTLGKLEDMASFRDLIDLLEHEDERMRSNAHWALKNISGRAFRADVRQWTAWHDAEEEWWATRAPDLLDQLKSPKAGDVAGAINELAIHRLYRHPIADELRSLLGSTRNDIVLLSCAAVSSLRSGAPVPDLIRALEHPDSRIQARALSALTAITGIDLPASSTAWREALDV